MCLGIGDGEVQPCVSHRAMLPREPFRPSYAPAEGTTNVIPQMSYMRAAIALVVWVRSHPSEPLLS